MRRPPTSGRLTRGSLLISSLMVVGLAACGGPVSNGSNHTSTGSRGATPLYRFGVVGNRGKIARLQLERPTAVGGVEGTITQIATSNSDGYALTASGAVYAWGVANDGELGNGTTPAYDTTAVRVRFPAGVTIAALADPMPFDGALAIDTDGQAWGWGLNGDGDLCLSKTINTVPARLALTDVTLASGARLHSLFDSHGKVVACGSDTDGVLGDGSTTTEGATPVAVVRLPSDVGVSALTTSWEGSGALLADGTYYDWGYNPHGQLGDGSRADSDVPVKVALPAPVRQVFQGGSGATNGQSVALLSDGSVWAWGDNGRGQVGDGTTTDAPVPVRVHVPADVRFVTVDSGGYASYAVDATGRLWAWGGNNNGQLGLGPGVRIETEPVAVGIHVTAVSSTASNVAAALIATS